MEFGLFTEFECPPGRSEATAFDQSMAQMVAAEALGYDVVWLAELHFQKDRSVLASPLVIASAIASRTHRVRIGIAVQVLPLGHPLRIAEDAATVDHLSKGRLEFGIGRSGLPGHYQGFNIPASESAERFRETYEILLKAWTEECFSYRGTFFTFHDVCIMPKPYQKPHPPLRMAATTEATYTQVGRMGLPLFAAVRTTSIDDVRGAVQRYHEGWVAAGHAGRGQVTLILPVYVAETDARARDETETSTMHFFHSISQALRQPDGATGPDADSRAARAARLGTLSWDRALAEQVVYGTPAAVADRLRALREEIGFTSISAWMNVGGQIPHGRVLESMRLFAERVMPRV